MVAKALTPILNVSDLEQSFQWFEKLGWKRGWDWGSPPTFGGVCSGNARFFCAKAVRVDEGKAAIGQLSVLIQTKPQKRLSGCPCGLMMHRRCVERGSKSRGRQPTCRGEFAKCISATQMAMCLGLAEAHMTRPVTTNISLQATACQLC